MAAPTTAACVKKALANPEPPTHGESRRTPAALPRQQLWARWESVSGTRLRERHAGLPGKRSLGCPRRTERLARLVGSPRIRFERWRPPPQWAGGRATGESPTGAVSFGFAMHRAWGCIAAAQSGPRWSERLHFGSSMMPWRVFGLWVYQSMPQSQSLKLLASHRCAISCARNSCSLVRLLVMRSRFLAASVAF